MSKVEFMASLCGVVFFGMMVLLTTVLLIDPAFAGTAQAGTSGAGTSLNAPVQKVKDIMANSGAQLIAALAVVFTATAVVRQWSTSAVIAGAGTATLAGLGIPVFESIGGVSALI